MTFFGMALLTAIGTLVLAAFAIVTAWYARKAFREQSREVAAIEQQVKDEQEVTRQQAELLRVQTGQLEVLRAQLDDQRSASAKQAEVLELQAAELRESLDERKRDARERRSAQAARVFIEEMRHPYISNPAVITGGTAYVKATIKNSSPDPVYGGELRWHLGSAPYGDPNPEPLGVIMPGTEVAKTRSFPRDANLDVCGAVLTFRDAAGTKWLRRPDGGLGEQP
jgi:hypothetical protein